MNKMYATYGQLASVFGGFSQVTDRDFGRAVAGIVANDPELSSGGLALHAKALCAEAAQAVADRFDEQVDLDEVQASIEKACFETLLRVDSRVRAAMPQTLAQDLPELIEVADES